MKLSKSYNTKLAGFAPRESAAIHAAWRLLTVAYELNMMDSDEAIEAGGALPALAGKPCVLVFNAARAALAEAFGSAAADRLYDAEMDSNNALYISNVRTWAKDLREQLDALAAEVEREREIERADERAEALWGEGARLAREGAPDVETAFLASVASMGTRLYPRSTMRESDSDFDLYFDYFRYGFEAGA